MYQWFQMQLYCNFILQLYSQILVSGQMQLYCNLCNYIATIFSNIGEWSNATILQLMQLYATYATILQQFRMQLYATMQLCNMQLMQLQQLYGTYETLRNFMQLYCNYMQLPKNVYWHDNLSSCFNECGTTK
jgi:hypothetical protein